MSNRIEKLFLFRMERQIGIQETEKFVTENSLACKLFIHQASQICQIAVVDTENKIRLLRESPTEQAFKENTEILSLRFHSTFLLVFPKKIFLLPRELQEGDHYPTVADMNDIDPDQVYTSVVSSQQCVANFIPRDEYQFWISTLKDIDLIPTTTIIINELSNLKVKYKALVGINFFQDAFEIILLEDNTLRFHNVFKATTPDEFNFFLLTTFSKLNIIPSITQFYLWGIEDENSVYYRKLEKYTRNISLLKATSEMSDIDLSNFSDVNLLTGAIECESYQVT